MYIYIYLCFNIKHTREQQLKKKTIFYLVYFPHMCNIKTLAIKIKLITSTGTGPTLRPGESSV